MSPDKIITMANQIATFFATQGEHRAKDGFADHINNFWEPRMRRQFLAMLDAGHEGFHPLVVSARSLVNEPAPEEA